jgi:SAM-dependent methyltransferase
MIALSGLYSTGHLGIPPPALTEAISRLPIAHEAFTFVDLGCGKGRALMVASAFPFRRLVGVEISPELCEIARANTARRPEWSDRISVINQDAIRFIFPDGPLLIFLYYPFLVGTIFRRVLSSLERQLRRAPREAYLLCVENPYEYEKVLQQFPFLRQIAESTHDLSPEDYTFWTDSKRTRLEVTKRDPSHARRYLRLMSCYRSVRQTPASHRAKKTIITTPSGSRSCLLYNARSRPTPNRAAPNKAPKAPRKSLLSARAATAIAIHTE